jgi:hypothetical protein
MNEAEWLAAASAVPLLTFLEREAVTLVDRVPHERRELVRLHLLGLTEGRKKRLLACAFARQVWPLLEDERSRHALVVAELFADGLADEGQLNAAVEDATQARDAVRVERLSGNRAGDRTARSAAIAAMMAVRFDIWQAAEESALAATRSSLCPTLADAQREQADLVRDIMGNPFRPPAIDQFWLTPAVVAVARAIYQEASFAQLPVLADALLDAGCSDVDILNHLRGPGPHALGCWALDLLWRVGR